MYILTKLFLVVFLIQSGAVCASATENQRALMNRVNGNNAMQNHINVPGANGALTGLRDAAQPPVFDAPQPSRVSTIRNFAVGALQGTGVALTAGVAAQYMLPAGALAQHCLGTPLDSLILLVGVPKPLSVAFALSGTYSMYRFVRALQNSDDPDRIKNVAKWFGWTASNVALFYAALYFGA